MPSNIVRRAENILQHLEANRADDRENVGATTDVTTETLNVAAPNTQLSFFQLDDPVLTAVRDEILHLDINNLTPMEALNRLHEIRKILTGQA